MFLLSISFHGYVLDIKAMPMKTNTQQKKKAYQFYLNDLSSNLKIFTQ